MNIEKYMIISHQMSVFLFVICIIVSGVVSETLQDTSLEIIDNPNDLQLTVKNVAAVTNEPLRLTFRQWLISTGVIGGTALSLLIDQKFSNFAKSHKLSKEKYLVDPWQVYGSPYMLLLGGGLYIAGITISNPSLRESGREALTAMIIAESITLTLKIIFGRVPPSGNNSSKDFNFFEFDQGAWSFPSGHATIAFSLSTVLSERISNPYITFVLYTTAFMVGVERVYNRRHWLSDVIMGAAIGTAIGKIVVKSSAKTGTHDKQWEILPRISSNIIGFQINYNLITAQ